MEFRKYIPAPQFRAHIAHYWTLVSEASESGSTYRFIPDGSVDWIFHESSPWTFHFSGNPEKSNTIQAHVLGQFRNHMDLRIPQDGLSLFGVSFHPWAARGIWNCDLNELTEMGVSIADLGGQDLADLPDVIGNCDSIQEKIIAIEAVVSKRICRSSQPSLEPVLNNLRTHDLKQVVHDLPISKRRLEQRFKTEVGLSPKRYSRIARVNKIIRKLITTPNVQLSDVAYDHNYFDQSHFISDFKTFAGCAPSEFLRSIDPCGPIYNFRVG